VHDGAGRPPSPSSSARTVFGARLHLAERFAAALADTGVTHGLIGPREVPRLWDRHLVNCAVVEDAFPRAGRVIDVGAGAGLPGLALAIVRPDLEIHLVEPMQRRTEWLAGIIDELGLDNCEVHRGRAEDLHGRLRAPSVTARAVARIDRLARWSFPLLDDGGQLIALKGRTAKEELDAHRAELAELGMVDARITEHGVGVLEEPTVTVDLTVGAVRRPTGKASRRRSSGGRSSGARSSGTRRSRAQPSSPGQGHRSNPRDRRR
jgi:16S rRNA (guanine527-N7)-methyltransferase